MMDSNSGNEEKYAIASVFHDIGIWTDQTFDYLEPSEHQAKLYLSEEGKQAWIEEIIAMIHFHHKLTPYRDRHENTVETFRKADWIDVSLGLIAFGCNRQTIKTNRNSFPNRGFHFFLLKETSKNIFKHPTRPLPMFMK